MSITTTTKSAAEAYRLEQADDLLRMAGFTRDEDGYYYPPTAGVLSDAEPTKKTKKPRRKPAKRRG